jgi:hypothetical protein
MAASDLKKRQIMTPNKPLYDRVNDHLPQDGEISGGVLFKQCCHPYGESTIDLLNVMQQMEQAGNVASRQDNGVTYYSRKK